LCGRQHTSERPEQLPVGGAAVRRLYEHHGEAPPEQRIAHRVGGELEREGDEPACLARSRARPSHGGILLEQSEEKRALGRKLPVDRALGEAGRLSDVVERGPRSANTFSPASRSSALVSAVRFCLIPIGIYDTH